MVIFAFIGQETKKLLSNPGIHGRTPAVSTDQPREKLCAMLRATAHHQCVCMLSSTCWVEGGGLVGFELLFVSLHVGIELCVLF